MVVEQQERESIGEGSSESPEVARLQKLLAEERREHAKAMAEKDRQITELVEYKDQIHTVLTNKDMSYRDRVIWGVTHIVHGKDIMAGRPFHANMVQIQTLAGAGKNGTGELFSAMVEAGGVKHEWDREKYMPEDSDTSKWSSAVRITALPGNALVNTKAATARVRQKEASAQSATRRVERLISLAIEACPNCGCTDPEQAQTLLVPRCGQCGKLRNSDYLVQTSALRIVEVVEEPVQMNDFAETSSAQDVSPQEVPTSQDTPSIEDTASGSEEIPDEPDDIKAQYEDQTPPETEITPTDIQRFQSAKAIFTAQGLDKPSGLGSFTFGDIVNEMQKIMNNPKRNEGQVRWLRQGINSALSKGGQRWRETT